MHCLENMFGRMPPEKRHCADERNDGNDRVRGLRCLLEDLGASSVSSRRGHEELTAPPARFLVLHENGELLGTELLSRLTPGAVNPDGVRTLLVLGDHLGFTKEEERYLAELQAVRTNVGPLPLLASHCIVLAHAALDVAALRVGGFHSVHGPADRKGQSQMADRDS